MLDYRDSAIVGVSSLLKGHYDRLRFRWSASSSLLDRVPESRFSGPPFCAGAVSVIVWACRKSDVHLSLKGAG